MLSALVAAAEKNHEFSAVLAEIHAISRPVVNFKLVNSVSNGSYLPEISKSDTSDAGLYLLFGPLIAERGKPIQIRVRPAGVR